MNKFLLSNKKTILLLGLVIGLIVLGLRFLNVFTPKIPLVNPKSELLETTKKIVPSETFIEYTDPAGFSFSYPDNLSIKATEIEDDNTFADLQLASKDINGSLNLKITESKLVSLEEWLKLNKITQTPKEVKLGSLKAIEVSLSDRLMLASLDQGVLFTIEMPLVEEDFWIKVYDKILSEFTFATPAAASTTQSDVSFEGEEVVE